MRAALADVASSNGGVFTRAQALACGYTERQVRALVAAGLWASLRHGIMVDAEQLALADDPRRAVLDIAAGRLTLADPTVGSDRSAAVAHGLPLLSNSRSVFLIGSHTVRRGTTRLPVLVRRGVVPQAQRTELNGVPLTTVARTLTDLSVAVPKLEAVVAIDAALHRRWATVEELAEIAAVVGTLPSLMQVLPDCDGLSESPLESISRVILMQQGIETPELQHDVRGPDGELIGRVDLWWGGYRVGGEADGLAKYDSPDRLRAEKLRQERIEQTGVHLVRWTWDEITEAPEMVAARIRAAFASRAR